MVTSMTDTRADMGDITTAAQEAHSSSGELVGAAQCLLDTADAIARQAQQLNQELRRPARRASAARPDALTHPDLRQEQSRTIESGDTLTPSLPRTRESSVPTGRTRSGRSLLLDPRECGVLTGGR